MKIKEATEILKSIGWQTYKEEGDRGAYFQLPDRTVDIGYEIKRFIDEQKFSVGLSLSTDAFSAICSRIRDEKNAYWQLIKAWNWPGIYAPEIKEEHIHQASNAALDWAKQQDLQQGILERAALPTSSYGVRPIFHLAALVLLGDIEKLKSYQACFAADDRLDFNPHITKDHIDRAVELAEQYAVGK